MDFDAVSPGYHMKKTHWNTVALDGSVPRGEVERMIDRWPDAMGMASCALSGDPAHSTAHIEFGDLV